MVPLRKRWYGKERDIKKEERIYKKRGNKLIKKKMEEEKERHRVRKLINNPYEGCGD